MKLFVLLVALPLVAAEAPLTPATQTTAEQREAVRDLDARVIKAQAPVDAVVAKLREQLAATPEFKALQALNTEREAKLKALNEVCQKGGLVLGVDPAKYEEYLHCNQVAKATQPK